MKPILRLASDQIYSLSRMVVGLLFMCNGVLKLFPVFETDSSAELFTRLWFAGVIECFGGGLIALGLLTPWVAFIASGEMAFAYFLSHYPRGFWPILNGGERAVFYSFTFLYYASRGSGPWSLDRLIWGRTAA